MPGPEFFETKMGRQFYDGTMPRIAKALERIAEVLELRAHADHLDWERILKVLSRPYDMRLDKADNKETTQ